MDILESLQERLKEEQWTRATIENYSIKDLESLEALVNQLIQEHKEKEAHEICLEFVNHSPKSIIGLYILGFLSYELEDKENTDAVLQVVDIFKENKKWKVEETLLKKILSYDKGNIYALQLLISLYTNSNIKDEKARIETLHELVRVDTENGDVAQKLAEYYDGQEKAGNTKSVIEAPGKKGQEKEANSVRYYKMALRRYAKAKHSKVEEIWKKLSPEIYEDINFFFSIASIISDYNLDTAVNLLTNYLEILEIEGKEDQAILVAKRILELDPIHQKMREKLAELYQSKYDESSQLATCLENSGILDLKIKIENAIKKFEKEILFEEGCYVYHKTWGIGNLEKVEDEDFILSFDKKDHHKMSYTMALKSLTPLNPDHIWVLKKEGKIGDVKEPAEMRRVLLSILRSFPGKSLSIDTFKEELVPDLIESKSWNSWWNKAKNVFKEVPSVGTVKEGRPKYFIRDIEIRFEEELINNFAQAKKFEEKLKIFEDFRKESHAVEEFSDDFKEMVGFFKKVVELPRYDFNEKLLSFTLLRRLKKNDPWVIDEVPGDINDYLDLDQVLDVLVQNYRAEYKKDIVDILYKYHVENIEALKEVLYHDRGQLAAYVMEKLEKEQTKDEMKVIIDQGINHLFKSNPYITAWLLQHLLQDANFEKFGYTLEELYIETLYRIDTLGKLIAQKKLNWFQPQLYSAEAKRILSMTNDFLFKHTDFEGFLLEHTDYNYIVKIYHLIKSSTGMSAKPKTNLIKKVLKKYPDIDRVKTEADMITHVTTNYFDDNVIWTSQEGLDTQQRKIAELNKEKELNAIDLEEARQKGDLKENAEYQAAREKEKNLSNEIMHLNDLIHKAKVLDTAHISGEIAIPGTTVDFEKDGKAESYTILGYWDTDETNHIIAYNSPLAKGIIGMKKGEERSFELGGETVNIKVVDIKAYKK